MEPGAGGCEAWFRSADLTVDEVLDIRQGVTPGGCLDVFLMPQEMAGRLGLEPELVHSAVKSKEIDRWSVAWNGRELL